jgi:hypothetical protein
MRLASAAIVLACVASATAGPDKSATSPWSVGVSRAEQATASALFEEGNVLFAKQAHAAAIEKYRAALAHWNHPKIRYNLAVALVRLQRILEASEELSLALHYGASPFDDDAGYQDALGIQALVEKQIADLDVSCRVGMRVTLDGKPWLTCPGSQHVRLLAGAHELVGEATGYLTLSRPLVLVGGVHVHEELTPVRLDDAVRVRYRHPRWLPWTVASSGAAVALAGVAVWFVGKSKMDRFENDLAVRCPAGCVPPPDLESERTTARFERGISIGLLSVGGAALVTGVVWAIANRPVRYIPVDVAPSPHGASVRLHWQF